MLGGRPRGRKNNKTLKRELELERIRQRVFAAVDPIVDGQLAAARGISYLYRIDKDEKGKQKKPVLVTSRQELEAYLRGDFEGDDDSYYYITTERPETSAAHLLLDRAFGKVTQPIGGDKDSPIRIEGVQITFKK